MFRTLLPPSLTVPLPPQGGLEYYASEAVLHKSNLKAPSGRELPTESGEGERVLKKDIEVECSALSFRHAFACHLPPQGGLK